LDGDDGLQKAMEIKPDLIISDVMMPLTDGIELCWMIRENSPIPMVPFIFLTSIADKEMEIKGFRAGADEYLVKPVDRNVLLEKVDTLLRRVRRVKAMDKDKSNVVKGFEGNLRDLSVVELIQLLNLNQRNGTLFIKGEETGKIAFVDGNIIHAIYGNITGKEAIYNIVQLTKGKFYFESGKTKTTQNIHNSTMNLLLEACRIADERNEDS
jgi:CheY-like chemotaxis protein